MEAPKGKRAFEKERSHDRSSIHALGGARVGESEFTAGRLSRVEFTGLFYRLREYVVIYTTHYTYSVASFQDQVFLHNNSNCSTKLCVGYIDSTVLICQESTLVGMISIGI